MYEPSQSTWFWKKGHCNKLTSWILEKGTLQQINKLVVTLYNIWCKFIFFKSCQCSFSEKCQLANIPNRASLVILSFNTYFQIWEHLVQTWEMLEMKVGDNGKTLDTLGNVKMLGDIRKKMFVCLTFLGAMEGCWKARQY